MIWQFYKYMFYHTYVQQCKVWGSFAFPEQTATGGMIWVFVTYIVSLLMLVKIITGFDISVFFGVSTQLLGLAIILPVMCFHYFTFLYKKRYKKIIKEFKEENENQERKGKLISRFYVYGSLGFFIVMTNILYVSVKYNFTVINYIEALLFHKPS